MDRNKSQRVQLLIASICLEKSASIREWAKRERKLVLCKQGAAAGPYVHAVYDSIKGAVTDLCFETLKYKSKILIRFTCQEM